MQHRTRITSLALALTALLICDLPGLAQRPGSGGSSRPSGGGGSSRPSGGSSGGSSGGISRPSSGGQTSRPSASPAPAPSRPSATPPSRPSTPAPTRPSTSAPSRPSPAPSSSPGSSSSSSSGSVRYVPREPSSSSSSPSVSYPTRTPTSADRTPAQQPTITRQPAPQRPSSGAPDLGSGASAPSTPLIEAAPRRVPFPRLTPATPSTSGPATSPGTIAPSSRLRLAPTTRDTRPSTSAPGASLPIAPTRAVDRDKILERYGRAPAADTTRTGSSDARGPSARVPTGAKSPSRDVVPTKPSREPSKTRERAPATETRKDSAGKGVSPDSIRKAREQYQAKKSAEIASKRGEYRAKQDQAVSARRDQYRDAQADSVAKRKASIAAEKTRKLRDLEARDPARARVVRTQGEYVACTSGLTIGLSISACYPWGWYAGYCWPWYSNCYSGYAGWGYWWGAGCYPYSWYCHPFSYPYYSWYGCWPYSIGYWWPSCYSWGYSPAVYYSTVIYEDDDDDDRPVEYVEVAPQAPSVEAQVGESVEYAAPLESVPAAQSSAASVLERGPDSSSRAATQYLSLGDRAFRDRRYSDAVHFYAKAVEFRPNDGVLYLVLSDALLATGDYHYGAFALRRALELDPTLAEQPLDKHSFYSDPSELDQQLQTLERYLADRPTDADARLLLAANYLFSARPLLANDLLESGASAQVRAEPAGQSILAAAKRAIDAKK